MTKLDAIETKAIDAGAGYWVNKRTCELIEKDDLRALVGIARAAEAWLKARDQLAAFDKDNDGDHGMPGSPCWNLWLPLFGAEESALAALRSAIAALEAPK